MILDGNPPFAFQSSMTLKNSLQLVRYWESIVWTSTGWGSGSSCVISILNYITTLWAGDFLENGFNGCGSQASITVGGDPGSPDLHSSAISDFQHSLTTLFLRTAVFWFAIIERGCTRCNLLGMLRNILWIGQSAINARGCTRNSEDNVSKHRSAPWYFYEEGSSEHIWKWQFILVGFLTIQRIAILYVGTVQCAWFIFQRTFFLNYVQGRGDGLRDYGWQILRGFGILLGAILLALKKSQARHKELIYIGGRRVQRDCRRNPRPRWSAIWLRILISNAHAIDVIKVIEPSIGTSWTLNTPQADTPPTFIRQGDDFNQSCGRLRLQPGSLRTDFGIDDHVYPLPRTIDEALHHPRILRLFDSWRDLCDLLTARGHPLDEPIKFLTYGHKGVHLGQRTFQAPHGTREAILHHIEALWQDSIQGASFLVHLVDPQPVDLPHDVTALLVEIPVDEVNVDEYSAILFEAFAYEEDSSDYDHVLRTEYALRLSASADIYELGSASTFCQPVGLHHCIIETRQTISSDADDNYIVLPGYYVVLQILPPSWHFQACGHFFHGAQAFAREALTLIDDPADPSIFVRAQGVSQDQVPHGQRSFLLHRRFFTNPEAVWNIALGLWSDAIARDDARIIYSPTPPQLESENVIHLLVVEGPLPGTLPILVSYFLPPDPPALFPRCLGTFAIQVEPPTSLHQLDTLVPPPETISQTNGSIWCEDH